MPVRHLSEIVQGRMATLLPAICSALGNPNARNLFKVVGKLQELAGVTLAVGAAAA